MLASMAKAQTLDSDKSLILCIAGGKHCGAETARTAPARAIKIEMASQEFGVRVDLTSHHMPSQSHLHSVHRLLTFHCLLHRFASSWSFRPARYVLPHSYLPYTHTAPNGISLVIPAHQIPFTLHPSSLALPHRLYAFRSPFKL